MNETNLTDHADHTSYTDYRPLGCPRCGGEMEQGFILDRGNHDIARQEYWYSGAPRRRRFWSLDLANRKKRLVDTLRCTDCGYLESYAIRVR